MSLAYYTILEDLVVTHNTDIGALYTTPENAAVLSAIANRIREETTPVGIANAEPFTGAGILTDQWATFLWFERYDYNPEWISTPPPVPKVPDGAVS